MAKSLVEALSEDFEPANYRDEYRLAVEQIIEQKAAGKTPVFTEAPTAKARSSTSLRRSRPACARRKRPARPIRQRQAPGPRV